MKKGLLTGLIIIILILIGCAAIQPRPDPIPGWSTLKEGVTTQQEVYNKYGNPVERWGSGRIHVWVYGIDTSKEVRLMFVSGVLSEKGVFKPGGGQYLNW